MAPLKGQVAALFGPEHAWHVRISSYRLTIEHRAPGHLSISCRAAEAQAAVLSVGNERRKVRVFCQAICLPEISVPPMFSAGNQIHRRTVSSYRR